MACVSVYDLSQRTRGGEVASPMDSYELPVEPEDDIGFIATGETTARNSGPILPSLSDIACCSSLSVSDASSLVGTSLLPRFSSWVRLRSQDVYHGDIAWMPAYDSEEQKQRIFIVPRWPVRRLGNLELTSTQSSLRGTIQRLFPSHVDDTLDPTMEIARGGATFLYGFIVIQVPFRRLIYGEVYPSVAELELWTKSPLCLPDSVSERFVSNFDAYLSECLSSCLSQTPCAAATSACVAVGDRVRLLTSRTSSCSAQVMSVRDGDRFLLLVQSGPSSSFHAVVPNACVVLDHQVGDIVEVFSGAFAGLSGWVVDLDWERKLVAVAFPCGLPPHCRSVQNLSIDASDTRSASKNRVYRFTGERSLALHAALPSGCFAGLP
ncbi:hypothetical protein R3P38DRAFT_2770256 [Favolaschia claudopus]|uniref:KOW domain-containing protein n=1 Tax=Favolaschia claudopus TaxID=2862362 RepID=A0AAW0CFA7_9AGAR